MILWQEVISELPARAPPRGVMLWLEQPHVKWAVPLPLLLAIAPFVWLFFRSTWRALDEEAYLHRKALHEAHKSDYRPVVALVLAAVILTVQEYYGGRQTYDEVVRRWLSHRETLHPHGWIKVSRYEELYSLAWWAFARVGGYVLPLVLWRIFFPRDSILDFGLRVRGFRAHAWIYSLFVVVMIPVMLLVARQPDFGTYYPFYKTASRSWLDLGMWEAIYVGQFFALEIFFRGWWVRAMRSFGAGAIFSMVVPYCMIHFGKPYLEACGAIVAGTVLGSLSMRTRSIYAGFLVHITVAVLMDLLALDRRGMLPQAWIPDGTRVFVFRHIHVVFWVVWAGALLLLAIKVVRMLWKRRRGAVAQGAASAGASSRGAELPRV